MDELRDLLQRAASEIKSLRNQNQLLSAKVQVYDDLMALFKSYPNYGNMAMAPDITWEIDRALSPQPVPENATPTAEN